MSTDEQVEAAFEVLMQAYEEKAWTAADRRQASDAAVRDFRHLLRQGLLRDGSPPTVAEVQGIKELVLDFLHVTPGRPPSPYGRGVF